MRSNKSCSCQCHGQDAETSSDKMGCARMSTRQQREGQRLGWFVSKMLSHAGTLCIRGRHGKGPRIFWNLGPFVLLLLVQETIDDHPRKERPLGLTDLIKVDAKWNVVAQKSDRKQTLKQNRQHVMLVLRVGFHTPNSICSSRIEMLRESREPPVDCYLQVKKIYPNPFDKIIRMMGEGFSSIGDGGKHIPR